MGRNKLCRLISGKDRLENFGSIESTTLSITPVPRMHIESIDMVLRRTSGSWYRAVATIKVLDENGQPVNDATVTVRWTGAVTGTSSTGEDQNGIATFTSSSARRGYYPLTFTVRVTGVTASGYVYYPGQNTANIRQHNYSLNG